MSTVRRGGLPGHRKCEVVPLRKLSKVQYAPLEKIFSTLLLSYKAVCPKGTQVSGSGGKLYGPPIPDLFPLWLR